MWADRKRNSRQTCKNRQSGSTDTEPCHLQRGQDTSPLSGYNGDLKKENDGYHAHLDPIWRLEWAQQTTIFRLRTGHCGLSAHLKRIGISDTSLCECGQADQTSDHVLQSCPIYNERCQQTWPQGADLATKLWGSTEDLYQTAGFVASTRLKIWPAWPSITEEEEEIGTYQHTHGFVKDTWCMGLWWAPTNRNMGLWQVPTNRYMGLWSQIANERYMGLWWAPTNRHMGLRCVPTNRNMGLRKVANDRYMGLWQAPTNRNMDLWWAPTNRNKDLWWVLTNRNMDLWWAPTNRNIGLWWAPTNRYMGLWWALNNNNNNRIQRCYSRFCTNSSQRHELSLTRTLKWPGCKSCATHRVLITCNCHVTWPTDTCVCDR